MVRPNPLKRQGRKVVDDPARNPESLKGRFFLDLSRFGSPIRLDVTGLAEKVRSDKWLLLAACLLIDFIGALASAAKLSSAKPCACALNSELPSQFLPCSGMASYLVLILGEAPAHHMSREEDLEILRVRDAALSLCFV